MKITLSILVAIFFIGYPFVYSQTDVTFVFKEKVSGVIVYSFETSNIDTCLTNIYFLQIPKNDTSFFYDSRSMNYKILSSASIFEKILGPKNSFYIKSSQKDSTNNLRFTKLLSIDFEKNKGCYKSNDFYRSQNDSNIYISFNFTGEINRFINCNYFISYNKEHQIPETGYCGFYNYDVENKFSVLVGIDSISSLKPEQMKVLNFIPSNIRFICYFPYY